MRMLSDSPTAVDDASSAPLFVTPASSTAATVGGALQPPAGGSDGSFDADMVILLAAMLCVLVCAIGLNSLVRCLRLHYSGHRTLTVAATHAAGTVAAIVPATTGAGLKKRELTRIPAVVYEPKAGGLVTEECAICLGEFDDGDKVRVLPRCHHGFHVQCIDAYWLATHSSCPTCRNSLLEEGSAGEATSTVEAGQGRT